MVEALPDSKRGRELAPISATLRTQGVSFFISRSSSSLRSEGDGVITVLLKSSCK